MSADENDIAAWALGGEPGFPTVAPQDEPLRGPIPASFIEYRRKKGWAAEQPLLDEIDRLRDQVESAARWSEEATQAMNEMLPYIGPQQTVAGQAIIRGTAMIALEERVRALLAGPGGSQEKPE